MFFENTESRSLCNANCGSAFEPAKVEYLAEAYPAAVADGRPASGCCSVSGWRNPGLLDRGSQPLPALAAFRFAPQVLHDALYQRDVTKLAGLTGFEFETMTVTVGLDPHDVA